MPQTVVKRLWSVHRSIIFYCAVDEAAALTGLRRSPDGFRGFVFQDDVHAFGHGFDWVRTFVFILCAHQTPVKHLFRLRFCCYLSANRAYQG